LPYESNKHNLQLKGDTKLFFYVMEQIIYSKL